MEAFPAIFPNPTVDFNGKASTTTVETKMDSGRKRRRRRFSSELTSLPVSWQMDDWEFGMFRAWVKNKISDGADKFTISLPVSGEGFKTVTVSLVGGEYTFKHSPVLNWTVSANLETEDSLIWDADTYTAKLTAGHP